MASKNNKYWLAKDILDIFKGYTEVKLNAGIENVIKKLINAY